MSKSFAVLLAVVVAASCWPQVAGAQVFSLDENPFAPIGPLPLSGATPYPPFGVGAEDPYGVAPPGVAPSPSLAAPTVGPLLDGDILFTGAAFPGEPEVNVPAPFDAAFGTGLPHAFINGLSNNSSPAPGVPIHLAFSIDRASMGMPGTASAVEAGFAQHPGDVYVTASTLADPAMFIGALPPGAGFVPGALNPPALGFNQLLFDESTFDLTPGFGPGPGGQIPPGVPAPPIGFATHDNVDAFELQLLDVTGDGIPDIDSYFTINPDAAVDQQFFAATFGPVPPNDPANIRYLPAGSLGADAIYALSGAIGLAPMPPLPPGPGAVGGNDIDGLVVWDPDADGIATVGIDFALFSLAPGSADLAAFGTSPADVFYTDFSGSYTIYATAADLGLLPTDNIDALEAPHSGDADLNGIVDAVDLATLAANYLLPGGWLQGNFDADGVVGLSDFVTVAQNLGTFSGATTPVPEPGAACGLAILILLRFKRRTRSIAMCAATLCLFAVAPINEARAVNISVNSSNLGNGLFQHALNVEITTGDVLGFELSVQDAAGRISDIDAFSGGIDTVFVNDAVLLTNGGDDPADDTHLLYDSGEGIHLRGFDGNPVDATTSFSVATAANAGAPLIIGPPGMSRAMFQLVTRGNIALFASRLRVNVGGANGDEIFDGFRLQMPPPPGDHDLDGDRDGDDLILWQQGGSSFPYSAADLTDWRANYGVPVPAFASVIGVPEPSATALALAASSICLGRRRWVRGCFS